MTHPFSAEFLRMAPAAEEIQAMRKHSPPDNPRYSDYKAGDWFIEHRADEITCIGDSILYTEGGIAQAEYSGEEEWPQAWLPLLHQLLGMLGDPADFFNLAEDFNHDWYDRFEAFRGDWHELALSVVMREKFGKRWDSKEGKWLAL